MKKLGETEGQPPETKHQQHLLPHQGILAIL